jgi:hypothetical protein
MFIFLCGSPNLTVRTRVGRFALVLKPMSHGAELMSATKNCVWLLVESNVRFHSADEPREPSGSDERRTHNGTDEKRQ